MSYIGNSPISSAFLTDTFSGNGTTTAFTMSVAPANTTSVIVAITGVLQDPSTYSVSGTTLTFSAAPPTGTSNISVRFLGLPASGVTTTAYRTVTDTTATAGQTSFSIPSYTVGYINVFRNGSLLAGSDYTATTGTTVVLTNAASAGDTITTESFYVSSVLNAIPATNASVQQTYLASGVAGTGPAFSAYSNANQTVTNATYTLITNNSEVFDTNSSFNNTASGNAYAFQPTVAGYYQIIASIRDNTGGAANNQFISCIYKNGSLYSATITNFAAAGVVGVVSVCTAIIYLNGSTDYVQQYVYQNQGSSITTNSNGTYSFFNGAMVRAA
jgi:hypothetical protein